MINLLEPSVHRVDVSAKFDQASGALFALEEALGRAESAQGRHDVYCVRARLGEVRALILGQRTLEDSRSSST